MKITVYGGASNKIDQKYICQGEILGKELAKRGHSLVYGGGNHGLMGAVARGVYSEKGHILGIAPNFFKKVDGELFAHCDEFIFTDTMRERKFLLEEHADAFIVTPGGVGTFEELFEVLTLKQLDQHKKAVIILNMDGYYDTLEKMIDEAIEKQFIRSTNKELYEVVSCVEEVFNYLDHYSVLNLSNNYRDI